MPGQMSFGGQTANLPYYPYGAPGVNYNGHNPNDYSWVDRYDNSQDPATTIIQAMLGPEAAGRLGTGAGPGRGDYMGGTGGAPRGMGVSPFPGRSFRSYDGRPDYHREIPMGGTPGVYAIRNDEIYGPRSDGLLDRWQQKSKRSGRYRTGGRRRRRR